MKLTQNRFNPHVHGERIDAAGEQQNAAAGAADGKTARSFSAVAVNVGVIADFDADCQLRIANVDFQLGKTAAQRVSDKAVEAVGIERKGFVGAA